MTRRPMRRAASFDVSAMRYARTTLEGAYQGVIRFFKGRDIGDVFEEFSEDALARGLHDRLVDGSAVLRDLRKVEQATGMELLPRDYGIDRAAADPDLMPLLEGFSKLARAHAWGQVRTGALPERTSRWMDMLVATQAGMLRQAEHTLVRSDLARAGQFKEALSRGEVTPELEKLLGESIGIGRVPTGPAAEIKPEDPSVASQELLQLSPSFSISREKALKLRNEIEEQAPLKASTQGIPTGMTAKEALQWAKGRGVNGSTSHPEIGEISINTRSIKNAIGHLLNPRKAAALAEMKGLVPASKLIHRHVRDGKPDSYRLAGRIDIDGVEYVARIVVDTDANGNRFYNHELSDLQELRQTKGPQTLIPGVDPRDQQIGVEELEDTGKLLRWIFSVKADEVTVLDANPSAENRLPTREGSREFRQPELSMSNGEPITVPDELFANLVGDMDNPYVERPDRGWEPLEGLPDHVKQVVQGQEEEIAGFAREHARIIDVNGLITLRKIGTGDAVSIPVGEGRGKILIHNHPNGRPPSWEDLIEGCEEGLLELRVVTDQDAFVVRFPSDAAVELQFFRAYYNSIGDAVKMEWMKRQGLEDPARADRLVHHAILEDLDRRGLIKYMRYKR